MKPSVTPGRTRLQEAAGEVFAGCGFRHAKAHEICRLSSWQPPLEQLTAGRIMRLCLANAGPKPAAKNFKLINQQGR